MKSIFHFLTVVTFFWAKLLLADVAANADEFSVAYRKAVTAEDRLSLCIKAIDQKLVQCGTPIATIDRMFGIRRGDWGNSKLQLEKGYFLVHFLDFEGNGKDSDGGSVAAPWAGWYLYIRYDTGAEEKAVTHFYISCAWPPTKGLNL